MDTLRRLVGLSPQRVQPPKVDTDDVFPCHFLDDTSVNRSVVLSWTLRFDDVLDADKLGQSLSRLLEIGDWRKLGGRLRISPKGKLVIHVPQEFTRDRPAIRYTNERFDTTIDEHPLAAQLPKQPASDEVPSIYDDAGRFRPLATGPGCPTCFDDYIYSDIPQIALHVVSFQDATLVSLAWSHSMTSALGRADLVKAWSLVLAGRESEVAPFIGAREDPIDGVGMPDDRDAEPSVLADKMMSKLGVLLFMFNFVWDAISGPKPAAQILCLPAKFVARLRQRAMDDLEAATAQSGPSTVPFISEGDVLSAWTTHLLARSAAAKNRPLIVMTVVDIRSRIKGVFQATGAYVQNMVLASSSLFAAGEAARVPLGETALRVRESIQEQVTEGQIKTMIRGVRIANGATPPMPGKPNSLLVIITNWNKARFSEIIDFSPAVVKSCSKRADHRPGRLVYQHSLIMRPSPMLRHILTVFGKDQYGNYWAIVVNPPAWRDELKKEIGL